MTTMRLSSLSRDSILQDNVISIIAVYTGAEQGCRCGCHGNYFKPGSKEFRSAVNKAFKLDPEIVLVDSNLSERLNALYDAVNKSHKAMAWIDANQWTRHNVEWIDIVFPDNKTITLYTVND